MNILLQFLQVIFVEQDVIKWTLWKASCVPLLPLPKVRCIPVFQGRWQSMFCWTAHFYVGKRSIFFARPYSFCLSYWILQAFSCLCADFCTPFSPFLNRGLSWRRNVFGMSLDYKPIPVYAVVLVCWLCEFAAGWQTQLEQVGEKKKKKTSWWYKPALCVLGSSTVYFYCTWSINLSIILCCHYFLIVFLYAHEMRVMHCFNLCEWPLMCAWQTRWGLPNALDVSVNKDVNSFLV